MLKCLVFVLCAVSLTTIVLCAPSSENIREKQSTHQDVTDQLIGASRTKRQTVEVIYLDAASLDSKLTGFQNKGSSRLPPVNHGTNYGQNFQQIPQSNLELVSQNSNFDVYKLNTGDAPLNGLPGGKRAEDSNNQYYSYGREQFSVYSGEGNPPPPDYGRPSQPPHHYPPPPPPHGRGPPRHHEGPPPPPPDFGRLTPHGGGPPDRFDRGPPHHHGGPPDRYYDRPPHHHGGPPDRYDDRPPHHHGGPPDRYDDRPPHDHGGPPGRRPHPPRDGPDRFDMRPPYNRPPPPPHDHKPPHDREPDDQGNKNNEKPQKGDNSDKVKVDGTQTSSTTEAEIDDDQYELDVRFSNVEEKAPETMKRDIPSGRTSARLLSPSPFIYQAAVVRPED